MNVMDTCDDLLEFLYESNKISRDEFFDRCVREKTRVIFERSDKQFDELIAKMDSSINYSDVRQVKRCVTKLLKLSARNRANVVSIIRRLSL